MRKKVYSSAEVIKIIEADGWAHVRTTGDHFHFRHPAKPGTTTVPHPKKELYKHEISSIRRQSGIDF